MTSKLGVILLSILVVALGNSVASAGAVAVRTGSVVSCGYGRHAVVHRIASNGRYVDRVTCLRGAGSTRVVYERVPYHRSWKKTAAVVGGATAAGAGIGALAGGGKGALVGGAIGAGAGTAYEVHKRHKHRHDYRVVRVR